MLLEIESNQMLHGFTPSSEGKPTTSTVNKSAKSQLARLLATENLSVEHKKIHTAMFDPKNRVLMLPTWDNMSGDLYDLLVGHEIGHALESPRDYAVKVKQVIADLDPKNPNGVSSFVNVIEDARIERLVKQRYPGLRRSFLLGYMELLDRDFFQTSKRDINSYKFIDRLNMHFKLGSLATVDFSDEEKPMIEMVADAETWDEVIEAVKHIYKFTKDNPETDRHESGDQEGEASEEAGQENKTKKQKNKKSKKSKKTKGKKEKKDSEKESSESEKGDDASESKEPGDESDGTNEDDDGDENSDSDSDSCDRGDDSDSEEEKSESGEAQGAGEGESDEGEEASDGEGEGEEESDEPVEGGEDTTEVGTGRAEDDARGGYGQDQTEAGLPEESLPASETDVAFEEAKKELATFLGADISYLNVNRNTLKLDKLVVKHRDIIADFEKQAKPSHGNPASDPFIIFGEAAKTFKSENARAISYMVKEFEMKKAADQYNRSSSARTGVIDTNKLHTYMFNDDIFRRITVVPGGKSHGFVMFIDWSGSMQENMQGTIDQLLNLIMFCRQVQIPFKVYGFTDGYARHASTGYIYGPAGQLAREHNMMPKHGDIVMADFALLNFFDSRMTNSEFEKMFKIMIWLRTAFDYNNPSRREIPAGYGLSGTPLNQAIVAAMQIVPEFQRETKAQIVSTIILTDGESNSLLGYYNSEADVNGKADRYSGLPWGHTWGHTVVIRDPISKAEVKMDDKLSPGEAVTKILLQILKERTGCRLVGYYIATRWRDVEQKFFGAETTEKKTALGVQFTTEKFASCTTAGYDEYFIIPGGKSLTAADKELVVTGKSSAALTKQFMQYNKQKEINRVILTRFVERIAK